MTEAAPKSSWFEQRKFVNWLGAELVLFDIEHDATAEIWLDITTFDSFAATIPLQSGDTVNISVGAQTSIVHRNDALQPHTCVLEARVAGGWRTKRTEVPARFRAAKTHVAEPEVPRDGPIYSEFDEEAGF